MSLRAQGRLVGFFRRAFSFNGILYYPLKMHIKVVLSPTRSYSVVKSVYDVLNLGLSDIRYYTMHISLFFFP